MAEDVAGYLKRLGATAWRTCAVALVVIGAAALVAGCSGGSGTPSSSTSGSTASGAPATTPGETVTKIGEPLKVGDLVFTVTSATLTKKLKSPLGNKSGNWMVVTIAVKNESKEAVTIDSSFFKLLEGDGTTYETDSDNLMYLSSGANFFLEKINPKLEKTGQVLFALPASAKDLKLQVQPSLFGGDTGVISLTK
jgi:hypothetical protein